MGYSEFQTRLDYITKPHLKEMSKGSNEKKANKMRKIFANIIYEILYIYA